MNDYPNARDCEHGNLLEAGKRIAALEKALAQIAGLKNTTKMRCDLLDTSCPDHKINAEGWQPIHPLIKKGVMCAVEIAQKALKPPTDTSKRGTD